MKSFILHSCLLFLAGFPLMSIHGFDIQFDYRFDSNGFFSGENQYRRKVLEAAAHVFEDRITTRTDAIIPGGVNTWSISFPHPSTGDPATVSNPVLQANSMTVYVGARDIEVLGTADVSVSYSGFQFWVDQIANRNTANRFDPWGGSITFNSGVSWYFDDDLETLESFPGKYDFFSIAVHELGHLMGIGTGSRAYMARVSNDTFQGAHAVALFGGPVPLSAPEDLEHWANTLRFDGQLAAMIMSITSNQRISFTELDFAVLRDVGHTITPPPPVVDQAPQWTGLPERIEMDEDTATSISFEISDDKTSVELLDIGIQIANPSLIAPQGIILSGKGRERQLDICPELNQHGDTRVSISLSDGRHTITHELLVVVLSVNDPPIVSEIPNFILFENETLSVSFTVEDVETPADRLLFSIESSNSDLIPEASTNVTGDGMEKELWLTPAPNQYGQAQLTLSVEDSDRAIVSRSFILTINPVTIHLDIIRVEDGLIVSWRGNGILQVADRVEGPYRDLLDVSSPLKVNDDRSQFYRMIRP